VERAQPEEQGLEVEGKHQEDKAQEPGDEAQGHEDEAQEPGDEAQGQEDEEQEPGDLAALLAEWEQAKTW
jgi:hypothetical protein